MNPSIETTGIFNVSIDFRPKILSVSLIEGILDNFKREYKVIGLVISLLLPLLNNYVNQNN